MEKVGIVLSGGGAKGAYQIGFWKAIKKLNIKYDIVTGTSVGALNGLMFVQKEYRKALKIWENIDYNFIFDDKIGDKFKKNRAYKVYLDEILECGGMETKGLEREIDKIYNKRKFFNSKIDFGIVTYNLTKLKPFFLKKSDMTESNVKEYVLASSCCFPAFKAKNILNEKYIDGGYYDNLPINLCVELGATKIISVDTKAIGIKKKSKYKNMNIIEISPKNRIVSFLKFEKNMCCEAIKYGYNDTMKAFGKLYGNLFSFNKKAHLKQIKIYNEYIKYYNKIEEIYNIKIEKTEIGIDRFIEIIENIGVILELEQSDVYSFKKYNKRIKQTLQELQYNDKVKIIIDILNIIRYGSNSKEIRKFLQKNKEQLLYSIYIFII